MFIEEYPLPRGLSRPAATWVKRGGRVMLRRAAKTALLPFSGLANEKPQDHEGQADHEPPELTGQKTQQEDDDTG